MPPTNKKPLSKAYMNQLVNLYSHVIDSGKDLDHLLTTDIKTYNKAMGTRLSTAGSLKQHRVKLRALRKHSNLVERLYRKKGKGKLSSLSDRDLRTYTKAKLKFGKLPKQIKVVPRPSTKTGYPSRVPRPSGSSEYGTFEIYDSKSQEYYYIKYKSVKDFNNKLRKLKDSIGKRLSYNFLGIDYYQSFVDDKFKKFVQSTLGV